jgi:hypothetical protein
MIFMFRITIMSCLVCILAGFLSLPVIAHELEGDRPDVTESSLTVPRSSLQIEAGYTIGDYGNMVEQSIGELLVRYGFLGFLEMRFGLNSYIIGEDDDGFTSGKDDLSAGLKLQLLRNASFTSAWVPNSALILGLTFPSGSGRYRGEGAEPRATLCVAWELPADFHFGSNFSMSYSVKDGVRSRNYSASFAFGYTLTDRIGIYIEHFLERLEEGETFHFCDAGLTLGITRDLQLDLRIGRSLYGPDAWFAGAGFIARTLDFL